MSKAPKVPFSLRLPPETLEALEAETSDDLKSRALAEAIITEAVTDGTATQIAKAKKKGQPR